MQSKLAFICDRIIEAGWLAALVFTPLYFNVYSSRVFEPDKISMLRNLVLMMTVAWFVKLIEGALARRSEGFRRGAKGALEDAAPGWLPALFRVPIMLPLVIYASLFLFTTLTSVVPLTSFFGSYQRLQGMISQYTYIFLAFMILANMRSRVQLERLITFAIVTSIPVAAYGLLQASGRDPLPWAGDVQSRVASTLGNAIFVAAYMIMIVPLTLQRWIGVIAVWRGHSAGPAAPRPTDPAADPWPLAVIGSGAVFLTVVIEFAGIVTGNSIQALGMPSSTGPDTLMWAFVLIVGALFAWMANSVANQGTRPFRRGEESSDFDPPPWLSATLPVVQIGILGGALYIAGQQAKDFTPWIILPGAIFIFYALTYLYTMAQRTTPTANTLQLVGLPLLLLMQVVVIFLTQSRGPELGLILGLAVFAFAFLWRRRMYRAFTALTVAAALFGGLLVVWNLPNSPIAAWRSLPYIGRLGLITQTEEGTGKVRTLIWGGAINLILSDPVRMIIGWGPESMYVAYNKFYPPDLGHWELRNATPDRSHDVFFDQAVTMGLLGLAAYVFLIGSFIWYAVRALRKAPRLHDQLILVGFLSVVVAHIGELVTGIQIVSTYTYFYTTIAATIVMGYVLTDYLRPSALVEEAEADAPAPSSLPTEELEAEPANGHEEAAIGTPARGRNVAVAGAARTNGRAAGATPAGRKGSMMVTPPPGPSGARRGPAGPPPGRLTPVGSGRSNSRTMSVRPTTVVGSYAAGRPLMLAVYALLVLIGVGVMVGLNVNLVKADMFYKQGLAYDNGRQWPGSIGFYDKAIQISPNEDFYYLFLGRSYMEWAKTQAANPQTFPGSPTPEDLLRSSEHALQTAKSLNPRNTDHYANLGRLYVYWGDATGAQDFYDKGVAQYEQAHALSPGNAEIWNEFALATAKAGYLDKALAAIHGSMQMDDRFAQTPYIAGEIERTYGDRYMAQAQVATSKELSATLVLSATQLAQAAAQDYVATIQLDATQLQQDDKFDQRISFLQEHNVLPTLEAGYQAVIDKAIQDKQKDPTLPYEPVQARAALGFIRWKLGKPAEALQQFERAVQLQCDDFYNLQNLGMLYRDNGKPEHALNTLQAALAVATCNPGDPYTNQCSTLRSNIAQGSCTSLSGNKDMGPTINAIQAEIQQLKQQLGRP